MQYEKLTVSTNRQISRRFDYVTCSKINENIPVTAWNWRFQSSSWTTCTPITNIAASTATPSTSPWWCPNWSMKLPSGQDCFVSKPCLLFRRYVSHPNLTANGVPSTPTAATSTPTSAQATMQTWPFVEIYSHKKYFYLEAQSYTIDGHAELFLWLWFLGESQMTGSFFIFDVFSISPFWTIKGLNPKNCITAITWLWFTANQNSATEVLFHQWQKALTI